MMPGPPIVSIFNFSIFNYGFNFHFFNVSIFKFGGIIHHGFLRSQLRQCIHVICANIQFMKNYVHVVARGFKYEYDINCSISTMRYGFSYTREYTRDNTIISLSDTHKTPHQPRPEESVFFSNNLKILNIYTIN